MSKVPTSSLRLSDLLTQLSPSVYLDPISKQSSLHNIQDRNVSSTRTKPPDIVLLLSWSGASPTHVTKYVLGYRALYPNTRVIVFMSAFSDFIHGSRPAQTRQYKLVVNAIAATPSAIVLVHIFSNGGSHTLWRLANMYKATQGCLLPMNALVLDSAPGKPSFQQSTAAILAGGPRPWYLRIPRKCLLYVMLCLLWVTDPITGWVSLVTHVWKWLNKPELLSLMAVRWYIYSHRDVMVSWKDVEEHADEAATKGYVVRKEAFEGSEHVAHLRLDPQRYWRIVNEVWEKSVEPNRRKEATVEKDLIG